MVTPPRRRVVRQSPKMIRDKSMSLKLDSNVVFNTLALFKGAASSTRRQTNAKILSPSAAHMSPPKPPLPPATADVILWRRVTLATIDGGASVASVGGKRLSSATHCRRAHARHSTNVELSSPPLRLYCIVDCYMIKIAPPGDGHSKGYGRRHRRERVGNILHRDGKTARSGPRRLYRQPPCSWSLLRPTCTALC